ncbi:CCA tRNA nucleotidyltransferase [Niallia sp. 03133]|uniref:CCA tRNA nucleotidyltransferase n=1 Tax=Niallia sp. 03133 TaxID=3458060 RepID=UPI004043D29E
MNNLFQEAIPIINKIESAGYAAYFVGGSVRDLLLGKEIHDIDIATSATPEEIKTIFDQTIDVGIQHGTVMVLFHKHTYEITTFRTESTYIDHRRPSEVFFVRNLKDDLKRRDFTMNAMAMDKNGRILDYFHGKDALKNKQIVTVGNANERFQEDALRMMRGIRFISTLDFTLEADTKKSIMENRRLLKEISVERITAEFEKLLEGVARNKALKDMAETKIYEYLPALNGKEHAVVQLSLLDTKLLNRQEMWALFLLLLNRKENKSIEAFLRDWKLPVKNIKQIQKIIIFVLKVQVYPWTAKDLYEATLPIAYSSEKVSNVFLQKKIDLQLLKESYEKLPIKSRQDLALTGRDVMAWSNKPSGPWIKELLEVVEQAVLTKKVQNEKSVIKEWLQSCHLI